MTQFINRLFQKITSFDFHETKTSSLPTYLNFDEKEKFFELIKIETIEEFDILERELPKLKGIFRGVSSASYKIYTSLQRKIIIENIETDYDLNKYVQTFKNNKLLIDSFKATKIVPSKLSIFSFLQHYGAPTPFLDFTKNFKTALYFATEGFNKKKYKKENSINDYFSILFIEEKNLDLLEIPGVIASIQKIKSLAKDAFSGYEDDAKNKDEIIDTNMDKLLDIATCKVFLISHYEKFTEVYNTNNNIRIIAQDGLFIYNDYQTKPLEHALSTFLVDAGALNFIGGEVDDMTETPQSKQNNEEYNSLLDEKRSFQKRLEQNIIKSYEIKKSLIPEILKRYNFKRTDIYPNPEDICNQIFIDSLAK